MTKKKLLSLLTAALFSMTACSQPVENSASKDSEIHTQTSEIFSEISSEVLSSEIPPSEADYYPVTLTDQAGRNVTIQKEPQRLVSAYYITTSALMALDLDDRLVGIEASADKRPIYALSSPSLLELPNVGSLKEFDLEGCAALEPDLVILPMKLKNSVESLEKLGINVMVVNPESQELLNEMMQLIGDATNTSTLANDITLFTDSQKNYLTDTLSDCDTPSVYLAGNSSMLLTAGDAMYQSDLIRLAGGKNVAADIADTYWAQVSYEQLLTWDPEYIILASSATYTVDDVLNDENLSTCTAVVNKNVYQMPNDAESWDSPVPGSILGATWLANILHNDIVSYDIYENIVNDYYENFYDFTYIQN